MRKIFFLFMMFYLFSLTPIYKKHAPVYFNKVSDFIRHLISPEKTPLINQKGTQPIRSASPEVMDKKIGLLNYGYINTR